MRFTVAHPLSCKRSATISTTTLSHVSMLLYFLPFQLDAEVQSLAHERQRLRNLRLSLAHEQEIFQAERAAWESRKVRSVRLQDYYVM